MNSYLDDEVLGDEDVPGGEVAVDALLGREELHAAADLAREREQLAQGDGARPLRYRPLVAVVAVPVLLGCYAMSSRGVILDPRYLLQRSAKRLFLACLTRARGESRNLGKYF